MTDHPAPTDLEMRLADARRRADLPADVRELLGAAATTIGATRLQLATVREVKDGYYTAMVDWRAAARGDASRNPDLREVSR